MAAAGWVWPWLWIWDVVAVCNSLRLHFLSLVSELVRLNVVEFRPWIIEHTSMSHQFDPLNQWVQGLFQCVDSSSSRSLQHHQDTGGNDCSIHHAGSDNWTHRNKCIGAHSHVQPHNHQRNLSTNISNVANIFGNWALPTWQTAW